MADRRPTAGTGLEQRSVLVTGGTGSFGQRFIQRAFRDHSPRRLVIFSRDELKQFEMSSSPELADPGGTVLRFFLGDVRDADRLRRAMRGVDVVVHAAALKQVPAAEYNPFEAVRTNVIGAQNVIEAALDTGVSRVVALSTDKAAAPINLYGATKLASDKLFVAANSARGAQDIRFSVVRYGNVLNSRGSVVPFFRSRRSTGVLPITDPAMTRFSITLDEGVDLVLWAIANALGGEIIVPRIPSLRVTDLATALAPECRQEVVGIRPGEKLHEAMITSADSLSTVEYAGRYLILPSGDDRLLRHYVEDKGAVPVSAGFEYTSDTNPHVLTVEELRRLLAEEIADL